MDIIRLDDISRCMSAHVRLYSWHKPVYQYVALTNLRQQWDTGHRTMLDVGGGTGIIAQTIKTLFGLDRVISIDVEDRFLPSLDIDTNTYDGERLPFPDSSFDCVLLFNVLHHVPVESRARLIRECRRVAGNGPIYIKDHLSMGLRDDARLALLDLLGNVPFHGMVRARYLRKHDWSTLAHEAAYNSSEYLFGNYRTGAFEVAFPNRLEINMKWRPA